MGFGLLSEFGLLNLWTAKQRQIPSLKKENSAKSRTNKVSGRLGGKTLFFTRFFQKSVRGMGQSPIIPHIIPRKNYSSANFATVSVICPLSSVFPGCMTSPASLRLRWSGNDESETESPVFMRF